MQIKLGEKIKELRKRDGRKQEDLAVVLGVTNQAVSRWEANGGYPDMEMIPAIANYFHITIDELFGYDNDRQTKIQSYIDQASQMQKTDLAAGVEILRNAISEFPVEWQLQYRLANALVSLGHEKNGQRIIVGGDEYTRYNTEHNAENEYWKEAVSLYEEGLKKEIDDESRRSIVSSLMWLYSFMGEQEKAEKVALTQSPVSYSREVLLAGASKNENTEKYRGEAILALLHELYMTIHVAVSAQYSLSHSQAGLDILLAVIGLYENIFDGGDYNIYHNDLSALYLDCSSIAMEMKDSEHALQYFECSLDHFLAFGKIRGKIPFTAPLLRKAKDYAPSIILLSREWFEEEMRSFPLECTEAIRNNPKYASIFAS